LKKNSLLGAYKLFKLSLLCGKRDWRQTTANFLMLEDILSQTGINNNKPFHPVCAANMCENLYGYYNTLLSIIAHMIRILRCGFAIHSLWIYTLSVVMILPMQMLRREFNSKNSGASWYKCILVW